jgi:hypothetical protein
MIKFASDLRQVDGFLRVLRFPPPIKLTSVLKMPVLSIYPEHGNPEVRAHLNRMVYPRDGRSDLKAQIVWTTTRMDMNNNHWIPNHFVPVLSIEISESKTDEYL